jgi:hypothetical protein
MQKHIYLFLFLLAGFAPLFSQEDAEGSKDSPLFTRMPGYHIYRYEDLQFDKYEFKVSDAIKLRLLKVIICSFTMI